MTGCIVETEAYAGIVDKASHAYNHRLTRRTEVMYRKGGIAYIYRCYGIHALLNVVTSAEGIPHAVLIRGVVPVDGQDIMESHLIRKIDLLKDGIGPGRLTRLMGISMDLNGTSLDGGNVLYIEDKHLKLEPKAILQGPRIGVDYAGDDALLPYRFRIEASYALEGIKRAGFL
jgi:DNA-3-methyladenine glycosylase